MRKKVIDTSTIRKLAVQADCDPRTIRRVLSTGVANTMSSKRALDALMQAGFIANEAQAA